MAGTATPAAVLAARRFRARYDVSRVVDEPGDWFVSTTMLLPHPIPTTGRLTLLCCVPGGGMTGQYFDLQVTGGGYSFAESAVGAGHGCVLVDNLGTGKSTREGDTLISPISVARANVEAFTCAVLDVKQQIPTAADVLTIGVGHSMGAMLTIIGQAVTGQHVAIATLGFTPAGLPQTLKPDELSRMARGLIDRRSLEQLAARRFSDDGEPDYLQRSAPFPFFLPDTDPMALQALAGAATNLLRLPGMLSLLPGNVAEHISHITVPVFLGGADHEPWHRAAELVPAFAGSRDISFFMLTGAAHNHNVAPTRQRLWQRIFWWADVIASSISVRRSQ